MTSSDTLERWSRAHISRFLGLFFTADGLPAPGDFEPPASTVLNYDPTNMPGTH